MKGVVHLTRSPRATKQAARSLAKKVLKRGVRKRAIVVALAGELGAGKTTFAQGLLRALGVKGRIVSPTFIFMRRYALPRNPAGFKNAYHFDLYRVQGKAGLRHTGLSAALRERNAIVLLEWPERAGRTLPKDAIMVHLKHGSAEHERHIRL